MGVCGLAAGVRLVLRWGVGVVVAVDERSRMCGERPGGHHPVC